MSLSAQGFLTVSASEPFGNFILTHFLADRQGLQTGIEFKKASYICHIMTPFIMTENTTDLCWMFAHRWIFVYVLCVCVKSKSYL